MEDYSCFPWSYSELFIKNILFQTDFETILACRQVCKGWREWFHQNSFWKQYLKYLKRFHPKPAQPFEAIPHEYHEEHIERISRYRLETLLFGCDVTILLEEEAFSLCAKIFKILRQQEKDLFPTVAKMTLYNLELLKKVLKEDKVINSFGPASAFLRLKVNNPLVKTIVTELVYNCLTCIIVDKKVEKIKAFKRFMLSTYRQDWGFTHFNPPLPPPETNVDAEIYGSKEEMLAAFERKAATAKRKRSAEHSLTEDEPGNKKSKTSPVITETPVEKSIYDMPVNGKINPYFPTVLELLDFDNLILKQYMIKKFQIDKFLVVPKLYDFLKQHSTMKDFVPDGFEVLGTDSEGIPFKHNPYCDGPCSDIAQVKYIENLEKRYLNTLQVTHFKEVVFWGRKDIRDRWSNFSEQLEEIEIEKKHD